MTIARNCRLRSHRFFSAWAALVSILLLLGGLAPSALAQQKRIYIGLDDHTDYMWTANEEQYRDAFIGMLDYYLDLADSTATKPSEHQSRFNTDGSFWIWTYERNKTATEFNRLIERIRSGHIGVPLNALVSMYGAQPAEAVLRGMYYPGRLERRYALRFPLVESMENQTMPFGVGSLWAGAGAQYSWRGVCGCNSHVWPGELSARDHEIYRWVGADSSSLIMKWYSFTESDSIGGYAEARYPVEAIDFVDTFAFTSKYPYNVVGLFGKGWDDLQTLTDEFVTTAETQETLGRKIFVSNELDFFKDFEAQFSSILPNVSLSYGNEWDLYSASMVEVTASVRRAVEKLRSAEALATLVALKQPAFLAGREAARDLAFMDLGLYWEHDWTANGPVPRSERAAWQRKLAGEINSYVDGLHNDAKAALGAMIPNPTTNVRFYAFNPLSWVRTDIADFPYTGPTPVHVIDVVSGLEVPSQIVTVDGQQRVRVLAQDVPSVGYKVFEVRTGASTVFPQAATVAGPIIENAAYRVTLGTNGAITSLIDKRVGNREFIRSIGGLTANDLGPGSGTMTVENAGPVSVTLKVSSDEPRQHDTRITLSAVDRVDIRNDINQNFSEVMTWAYGFNIDSPVTRHEEVGAVVKAAYPSNGGVYSERASRFDWLTLNHFVDLTAGVENAGVTLSSADLSFMRLGNSGGEANRSYLDTTTPQVTVLAGGQVDGPPLGIPDQGGDTHFLQRFALRTHGAYDATAAMRFSMEHQNPLTTGVVGGGSGYPANTYSLISVSNPNVLLWAVKPADDGIEAGVVLRLWNLGTAGPFSVTTGMPVTAAQRTTHIETPLEGATFSGNTLFASANSQQIVTYQLLATVGPVLTPTTTGFKVRFDRPIDVEKLNLYGSALTGEGPADVTLVGAATGAVRGSLVVDPDHYGFTFIKTNGLLSADTYTVTMATSRSDGLVAVAGAGALTDGNSNGVSATDYTRMFIVAPASGPVLSIGEFARGPGQPVNVPASNASAGIPVRISQGAGVTSVAFTLRYDPTLLTLQNVNLASGITGTFAQKSIDNVAGQAQILVNSLTGLTNNTAILLSLQAQLPPKAPYASKHVLDIQALQFNAGAIAGRDDDGLHVVALVGDASGNAGYSALDLQRMQRVISFLDTGFSAFQNADPVIVSDTSGNGDLNSLDLTLLTREFSGIDQPQIPPIPAGLLPIVRGGPDPYVSLTHGLGASAGEIVTIPVTLDTAVGLESAQLTLRYDMASFEIVDVRRGTLTESFRWFVRREQPGELVIHMAGAEPLNGGTGSLMEVDLRVKMDAPSGMKPIDLQSAVLSDGRLTLNPAPRPGIDQTDTLVRIVGEGLRVPSGELVIQRAHIDP